MGLDRGIKKNETLIKREKKRVKKERRQRKIKDLDSNVKGYNFRLDAPTGEI